MKTSSEPALRRYSLNGETMGSRYTAVFYAGGQADLAAIGASLFAAVDQVDRQMSTWNAASDLCRLNAAPENTWLPVPQELAQVLAAGLLSACAQAAQAADMAPAIRISRVSIRVSTEPLKATTMLAMQKVVASKPITAPWPCALKRSAHQPCITVLYSAFGMPNSTMAAMPTQILPSAKIPTAKATPQAYQLARSSGAWRLGPPASRDVTVIVPHSPTFTQAMACAS